MPKKAAPKTTPAVEKQKKPKVEKAQVEKPKKSTQKVKVQVEEKEAPKSPHFNFLTAQLDDIEKITHVAGSNLQSQHKLSTGFLIPDLVMGGGVASGWTGFSGFEGAGKSVMAMSILRSSIQNNVMAVYSDPEGSVASGFAQNILMVKDLAEVVGVKDKKGNYIVPPRIRYYDDNGLETIFKVFKSILLRLPEKRYNSEAGSWFYVMDKDKKGTALKNALGLPVDKVLTDKTGRFWCPAEDGSLQAMLFIDSLPMLVPEDIADDEKKDSQGIALLARSYSQQIPAVKGRLRSRHVGLVAINQLREKPMVMFGCHHGSVRITMADGSRKTIKEIVETRDAGPVLSYNTSTNKFEAKPIVNWFNNGPAESWLKITYRIPVNKRGNTKQSIIVTPNHYLWSGLYSTFMQAKDLKVGESFVSPTEMVVGEYIRQLVLGSMIGDGYTETHPKVPGYYKVTINHKLDHKWLLEFKKAIFGVQAFTYDSVNQNHSLCVLETKYMYDPNIYQETIFRKDGVEGKQLKNMSKWLMENIGTFGLAILWMDDASKSNNVIKMLSYNLDTVVEFVETINKRFRAKCQVKTWNDSETERTGYKGWGVLFCDKIMKLIAPYICEEFKQEVIDRVYINARSGGTKSIEALNNRVPKWVNRFGTHKFTGAETSIVGTPVLIEKIEKVVSDTSRQVQERKDDVFIYNKVIGGNTKYDIQIQDLATYVADGIVSHNSPITEPCGNAVKFACDNKSWIVSRAVPEAQGWTKGLNEEGKPTSVFSEEPSVEIENGKDLYCFKRFENQKNKYGQPFRKGWFRVCIKNAKLNAGTGIDPCYDVLMYLVSTGQLAGSVKKGFKINLPIKGITEINWTWLAFKAAILGEFYGNTKLFAKSAELLKLDKVPKNIRATCFDQLKDGSAETLYNNRQLQKNGSIVEKEEDLEADDED